MNQVLLFSICYALGAIVSFVLMPRLTSLAEEGSGSGCILFILAIVFPFGWLVLFMLDDIVLVRNPLDLLASWINSRKWK